MKLSVKPQHQASIDARVAQWRGILEAAIKDLDEQIEEDLRQGKSFRWRFSILCDEKENEIPYSVYRKQCPMIVRRTKLGVVYKIRWRYGYQEGLRIKVAGMRPRFWYWLLLTIREAVQ